MHLVSQDNSHPGNINILPDPKYVRAHLVPPLISNQRWRILYAPYFKRTLMNLCRNEGIQILHDHSLWNPSNHAAATIARRLNIPLIIQPRGTLEPYCLAHRSWKKKAAWALYQNRNLKTASAFVASAEQEAKFIYDLGFRQPIAISPNSIELPELGAKTPQNRAVRHALFLSRIHPVKGLLNLVAAWDQVRPNGWKMIVAGPDEENHRAQIERAIKNAKLGQDFEFVGPVAGSAKETLFRNADLFILPTFSENFGIVVAEALSYGLPVITTKGAPWAALLTNRCGWWVDPNAESIAEALREATSISYQDRHDMGRRGRQLVESEFSWQKIGFETLALYKWILGQGGKPSCVIS